MFSICPTSRPNFKFLARKIFVDLVKEIGPNINPIGRQLLEAFKRGDADAQHFAVLSIGSSLCKDKFLEQINKDFKAELTKTHEKITSINEAIQKIKPYVEKSFKDEIKSSRQARGKAHEEDLTHLEEMVPKIARGL